MMLNDKEFSILNSIYQLGRPVHIDELAEQHKLSPRSIRAYVSRIHSALGCECIMLKKGYYHVEEPGFLTEFFGNYQVTNYSAQVLVQFMLHKLAIENKVNLSHFVTEFEVSRTTAKNYLNQVKEQLDPYHLSLEHGAGILLLGAEGDKRQLILNLMLQRTQRDPVAEGLFQRLWAPFQEEKTCEIVRNFLREMLQTLRFTLSQHSYEILFCYLCIICVRIPQGKTLTCVLNQPFLRGSKEYQSTKALFETFEEDLGMRLSTEETLEIINKVMGLYYSTDKESEQHNWFEYDLFISKLIRRFSKECGHHLVGDFTLYENLLNHIKPAMYRIANNIDLHPFDHDYIMETSKDEFEITSRILKQLHFFPSDEDISKYHDEIALICVYFKQGIQKLANEEKKDVLLVSNYGYGTSRMIMEKIRQHYQVGRIEWVPTHELQHMDLAQFQLLITTDIRHEGEEKLPIVHISPFLQGEDRHRLGAHLFPKESPKINLSEMMALVEEHCQGADLEDLQEEILNKWEDVFQDDRKKNRTILEFFEESTILLDYDGDSINQVLQKAGALLQENGYIQESYIPELQQSFENYGVYMMIDTDVAIPHTKNLGNVIKTGFSFIRLQKPIHFEDHELSMFFTFCTRNNKEHLEALVSIADIVRSKNLKKSLEKMETAEEILRFLAENQEIN